MLAALLSLALPIGALAQGNGGDEVVELDPFITEIELEEDTVLPTLLSANSVFGFDKNLLDAPRAVSTITAGQLEDKNIQRVEDLDQFISGAYSAPIFGNIGVPFIRGDLGEVYQNGQRRAFNRNSFPISFNGIEGIEAVKGAPPAVYGYGNATGGYVNLVTKRPQFDDTRTEVKLTAGEWDNYRWQLDHGGPLNESWAYRISYEGHDSDSFYRLAENRSQALFAALSYRSEGNFRWYLNAEYLDADFTEVPGTNRPTQQLIDEGLYITGESISAGAPFFGNTFEPTGVVRIDGSQILLAPGDGAFAKVFNIQSIAEWNLTEGKLVNRTYFEDIEAQKNSSYYFFSHLPESYTFENRTEYLRTFTWAGTRHELIAGFAYRYEYRKSFVDIFNEYFNPFDVTGDPDDLRYPTDQLFGVLPVPGTDGFAIPGGRYPRNDGSGRTTTSLSATLNSTLHAFGLFAQDFIQLNRNWALLVGTRLDYLDIHSEDPLPQPGFDPVSDTNAKPLVSGTASLTWKPRNWATSYVTINYAAAVESSSSSGGFGLNSNEIKDEVLENGSELIEVGQKFSLLENRLFASGAMYYQKRNRTSPRGGLPDEIEISGIEVDVIYQPHRQLNLGFIGSYAEANYIDGPVSGTPTTQAPFSPSEPNSTFPRPPLGDYRLPGLPFWLLNGFVTWKSDLGFGASATLQWQSEQNLDLDGFVVIPSQHQLDLAVFYQTEQLEVRVEVVNATDEFNWRPTSTPFAGADLVTRELPRHYMASLIFRF